MARYGTVSPPIFSRGDLFGAEEKLDHLEMAFGDGWPFDERRMRKLWVDFCEFRDGGPCFVFQYRRGLIKGSLESILTFLEYDYLEETEGIWGWWISEKVGCDCFTIFVIRYLNSIFTNYELV